MDAFRAPTALSFIGAEPICFKCLLSDIPAHLKGLEYLYERQLRPSLLGCLHQLVLPLARTSVHVVNMLLDAFPYCQIENIEHGRIARLLNELDVEFVVHHGFELLERAVPARNTVATSRIDLELHAPGRVPELHVFAAHDSTHFEVESFLDLHFEVKTRLFGAPSGLAIRRVPRGRLRYLLRRKLP